ncbi:MAG: Amuc_1102 family pilus-like protein [Verrucomicrobiaceae bacterium]
MKIGKLIKTLACATLTIGAASAQDEMPTPSKTNKIDVDGPKYVELPSPDISAGGVNKKFRPKDWLEIEVQMKVTKVKPEPQDEYLDNVTVKWWIVVKGQDRKTYLMEKSIQHVNIPVGEQVVSSVYLSPNALKRITGKDSAGDNDLEAVGGEVHYNGELVGFFSDKLKAGWWRKDLGSVERTQKFPLLDKNETPFKFLWYDRYAEIAPKND